MNTTEHEERMCRQAEHNARNVREKAIREETKEPSEEGNRYWREDEAQWSALLAPSIPAASNESTLGLADIPSYIASVQRQELPVPHRRPPIDPIFTFHRQRQGSGHSEKGAL